MRLFTWLIAWFRGGKADTPEALRAEHARNLKKVRKRQSRPQARAHAEALAEHPAPHEPEKAITAAYRQELADTEARFKPRIDAIKAEFSELLAGTGGAERLDAVVQSCAVDLARVRAEYQPRLVAACRALRQALRALTAFRDRHELLEREAQYPASHLLHYAALAFMILIEGFVNAWAFAEDSPLGLLGGLVQALVVAGANVAFAFFAGRAASGLFHRRWRIKGLALGCVGAWVVFEVVFALQVAHFRIALTQDADNAIWLAVARLLDRPLAIDDVYSLLLTLCTLSFGAAALATGLHTDDRYPGYGRITRHYLRLNHRLEHLHAQYRACIDRVFGAAPARLAACLSAAETRRQTFRRRLHLLERLTTALEHAIAELGAAHREDLRAYRAAYVAVRGTSPSAFAGAPAPLESGKLLGHAQKLVAAATTELAAFPARLERLEAQRAALEAEVRQLHREAIEEAPRFFAETEDLAEQEAAADASAAAEPETAKAGAPGNGADRPPEAAPVPETPVPDRAAPGPDLEAPVH